jgi:hypothetical protein
MFPAQAGIKGTLDLPVVVYAAVIITILLFATGFPVMRRKLLSSDPEFFAGEPGTHRASPPFDRAAGASTPREEDKATPLHDE